VGIIEKRLDLAAEADLALAFYNPISRARPWQLGQALEIVAPASQAQTPVTLGRDIGRPGQALHVTSRSGNSTPEHGGHAHDGADRFLDHVHFSQTRRW
jgi:cobalt-precorrin 5A hydrolase/precorrin-3B C17-methyltransferase